MQVKTHRVRQSFNHCRSALRAAMLCWLQTRNVNWPAAAAGTTTNTTTDTVTDTAIDTATIGSSAFSTLRTSL